MMAEEKKDDSTTTVVATDGSSVEVPVPPHFLCPLSSKIMIDPVMTVHGQTFDKPAILNWLKSQGKGDRGSCPLTGKPLKPSLLVSNHILCSQIRSWREAHVIADQGGNQEKQQQQQAQPSRSTVSSPTSVVDGAQQEPQEVSHSDPSQSGLREEPTALALRRKSSAVMTPRRTMSLGINGGEGVRNVIGETANLESPARLLQRQDSNAALPVRRSSPRRSVQRHESSSEHPQPQQQNHDEPAPPPMTSREARSGDRPALLCRDRRSVRPALSTPAALRTMAKATTLPPSSSEAPPPRRGVLRETSSIMAADRVSSPSSPPPRRGVLRQSSSMVAKERPASSSSPSAALEQLVSCPERRCGRSSGGDRRMAPGRQNSRSVRSTLSTPATLHTMAKSTSSATVPSSRSPNATATPPCRGLLRRESSAMAPRRSPSSRLDSMQQVPDQDCGTRRPSAPRRENSRMVRSSLTTPAATLQTMAEARSSSHETTNTETAARPPRRGLLRRESSVMSPRTGTELPSSEKERRPEAPRRENSRLLQAALSTPAVLHAMAGAGAADQSPTDTGPSPPPPRRGVLRRESSAMVPRSSVITPSPADSLSEKGSVPSSSEHASTGASSETVKDTPKQQECPSSEDGGVALASSLPPGLLDAAAISASTSSDSSDCTILESSESTLEEFSESSESTLEEEPWELASEEEPSESSESTLEEEPSESSESTLEEEPSESLLTLEEEPSELLLTLEEEPSESLLTLEEEPSESSESTLEGGPSESSESTLEGDPSESSESTLDEDPSESREWALQDDLSESSESTLEENPWESSEMAPSSSSTLHCHSCASDVPSSSSKKMHALGVAPPPRRRHSDANFQPSGSRAISGPDGGWGLPRRSSSEPSRTSLRQHQEQRKRELASTPLSPVFGPLCRDSRNEAIQLSRGGKEDMPRTSISPRDCNPHASKGAGLLPGKTLLHSLASDGVSMLSHS